MTKQVGYFNATPDVMENLLLDRLLQLETDNLISEMWSFMRSQVTSSLSN
jgi:hypothetical protein